MSVGNVSYHQAFDFDTGKIMDESQDKCIPRFFLKEKLGENGIVHDEMVEIITPGDRLSRPVQRVTDIHRKRWVRAYDAFKTGIEPSVAGTPIATWSELGWQMQNELRAMGFQTIEQLAEASDGQLSEMNNGTLWRKKAQVFVANKQSGVQKDTEIDALRKQIEALTALVKGNADVLPQSEKNHAGKDPAKSGGKTSQHKTGRRPGRPRNPERVALVPGDAPANGTTG